MYRYKLIYKISLCLRAFMVTVLLLLVLVFIQAIALEIYSFGLFTTKTSSRQARQSATEPLDHSQLVNRSQKLFLPDGTMNLLYRDYQLPENERARIYDTNDNLLWQGKDDNLPDKYLKWPDTPRRYLNTYTLYRYRAIYPDPRRSIVVPVLNGTDIESLWRYEISGGYFTGFDRDGNRIGYCGSSGFVQEQSQIKPLKQPENFITWIPIQDSGPVVLWLTEHNIYQIDFRKQSIESLLQLPDRKITRTEIQGWMRLASDSALYFNNDKYRPLIVCWTKDNSVVAILRDPNQTIQINLPEESHERITNVTATNQKIYMQALNRGLNPPKEIARNSEAFIKWYQEHSKEPFTNSEQLYEVNSSGNLTLINKFEWTSEPRPIYTDPQEKLRKVLTKFSPPFYDIFGRLLFRYTWSSLYENNRDLYGALVSLIHFSPSYNPVSYLLSLLMAGIVFIHARPRRKSMTGLIAWVVFAALFNIVGLAVYLALNYTPTIQCHKCGKRRGLNMPLCPHCNADLLTNAPDKLCIIAMT